MTDSVLKPAEFRPATNYDTNPYYDENFDHTVTDPFKKIDERLDALEETSGSQSFLFRILEPAVENGPMTLDKTYAEFEAAVQSGYPIYQHLVSAGGAGEPAVPAGYSAQTFVSMWSATGQYVVNLVSSSGNPIAFFAASKDGVLTENTPT